jgi:protein involved in polysaccharide export with SLBB domain
VENLAKIELKDNPLLKRGDRILIVADANEQKDFRAFISGEVNFPGSIPITKNSTTLRDVIKKAGGFRSNADLNRAELVRGANVFQSLFFSDEFEHLLMSRTADISDEDSVSFLVDNKLRVARGNGLIDFENVTSDTSRDGDFIVRDGDFIFVPERLNLVYVFGQVASPGYVEHVTGKNPAYYLGKAGGVAKTAKGEVYLIKGKTRAWIEAEEGKNLAIEPGDFIWVPKVHPRDLNYYLVRIGSVAQIVAALATVIILFRQF